MCSENPITSNRGSVPPPHAASAANTNPLHDGPDAVVPWNVVQVLLDMGKEEQRKPKFGAARGGALSGAALHRGHEKHRLLMNQPQLTLEEHIRILCSPPSERKDKVHKSIPKKLPRAVLRKLRTKDGRRKINEELQELWKNLDIENQMECNKRAADIASMLSCHKHASKRG